MNCTGYTATQIDELMRNHNIYRDAFAASEMQVRELKEKLKHTESKLENVDYYRTKVENFRARLRHVLDIETANPLLPEILGAIKALKHRAQGRNHVTATECRATEQHLDHLRHEGEIADLTCQRDFFEKSYKEAEQKLKQTQANNDELRRQLKGADQTNAGLREIKDRLCSQLNQIKRALS